jgi:nicotinamidase-related amidase
VPKSSTALLVIDMQELALVGSDDADEVIGRINDLSRRAEDAGAPVIFIQHEDEEYVKGSPGWQLSAALERRDTAVVVEKTYRDGFAATELEDTLERLGVRRLVVVGAHSDLCVQMTALSAVMHGFDLVLVSDGHLAFPDDPALSAQALRELVNARMATLRHPERTIEVVPAAEVAW